MKSRLFVLLPLVFLLLSSCATTTDAYVSDTVWKDDLTLEEKLVHYGGEKTSVPVPEMFFDGTEWLHALEQRIASAEDYILISTFLGSSSEALEPLYEAIMEKAESGVDVYFIMDGTSSYDMTETQYFMTPLYFLRDAGVHLLEYSPMSAMRLLNPVSLIIRDHRKLVVIDGRLAAIGGLNLNYISMGAGEGRTQRDSMYLFDSPALAATLMRAFVDNWNAASVEKLSYDDFAVYPDESGTYDAWLFNRGPGSDASISGMFASLFSSAEDHILMFPYLPILNDDMAEGVRRAVDGGVKVEMVMPVDLRGYAAGGVYHYLPSLLDSTGADVYLSIYGENGEVLPLLHEKLMIVDSRYVVIGSTNFNFRSMELSHELSLVIDSPEMAAELERHAEEIKSFSVHVTRDEAERLKDEQGNFFAYLFMYYGG